MSAPEKLRTSYLIKRVELLVRNAMESGLRDLDITTGQYAALSLLSSMPEASSAQLARSIGVTPQTMTETILAFENRKLITRTRSSEHKRILKISLTGEGRKLLEQCEIRADQIEEKLFAALDSNALELLRTQLHDIVKGAEDTRN